jgi:hypothetical protein
MVVPYLPQRTGEQARAWISRDIKDWRLANLRGGSVRQGEFIDVADGIVRARIIRRA